VKQGNKYRIYPTNEEQRVLLEKHFGAVRFTYNYLLDIKRTMQIGYHIAISKEFLDEQILLAKKQYPWLKEINAQSLQGASKNLDNAYSRYYQGLAEYPKEHKKKDNHFSFQVPQAYKINVTTSKIYLPKIGWLTLVLHRELFKSEKNIKTTIINNETIIEHDLNSEFLKTATVSRTSAGRYHISILTEDGTEKPKVQPFNDLIGVDVGLKTYAICSDGKTIENPRFLRTSMKKLKMLHGRVSRKVKGSKNRKKAVKQLAKQYQLVSNQRNDFQHKASNELVSENQAIALETLNIKGMVKNHCLAQAVSDAAWNGFVNKILYKAEKVGKAIFKIGQFEPSSKNCHVCGYHNSELTLKDREWMCPECNTLHDRDINAAINIKKFALMAYQITLGTRGRACGVTEDTQSVEAGSHSVFS
jgi:putative transposase